MSTSEKILSLGDCNTLGIKDCELNAYPERFARLLSADVKNCGFTMSTLREAEQFFKQFYDEQITIITVLYGLVDSWETFKYAPYVLYYPDNPLRKIKRKLVKKYKKTCRKMGLNDLLGTEHVVPPKEYVERLRRLIQESSSQTRIALIESIPDHDERKNPGIQKYNKLLKQVQESEDRCILIETYDYFSEHLDSLYIDETHINADGHDYIARKLYDQLKPEN